MSRDDGPAAPGLQVVGLHARFGPGPQAIGRDDAGRNDAGLVDVDLDFGPARLTAIVGPNGAGKSTLLSLMAGLRRPDRGDVRLDGRSLRDWPRDARARRLAWLSQQGEANGDIAAIDVVRLGRLPHRGLLGLRAGAGADAVAEDEACVAAAMAETECAHLGSRRLGTLSGGERQRVLLARALAVRADVLLLDEPTSHLDVPHQRMLVRSLRGRAAAGAIVVAVLHELSLALAADRIVVMQAGRVAAVGAPDDPGLQRRLIAVFGDALTIERIDGGRRLVAVPRLDD